MKSLLSVCPSVSSAFFPGIADWLVFCNFWDNDFWHDFWVSSYGPKCCQPVKLPDSLKCNISRKKWMMKYIFGIHINIEVFYKMILSFSVSLSRHAQSNQFKFAYLCNISTKMGDEVDFLPADKHKSFLQVDSITLGGQSQTCPGYPKQQVYNIFAISQGKYEGWSWFFACW